VKCLDAAAILVRRHDEATLGEIRCLLDILEAGDDRGLVSSVVLAGIDLADGNPDLTEGESPKAFASALPLSLRFRWAATLSKLSGSVSA
jgi:hypothetical protein